MSTNDGDSRRDAELAPFFGAMRKAAPEPSADLLARVLKDAEAAQARHAAPVRTSAQRAGVWGRIAQGLGGWPAMAGLGAAGLAGVWIGLALPATLPGVTTDTGDYVVDVAPGPILGTGGGF